MTNTPKVTVQIIPLTMGQGFAFAFGAFFGWRFAGWIYSLVW